MTDPTPEPTSEPTSEPTGEIDDETEAGVESSTTDGPAAEGEYDAAQGSPAPAHPVGEGFPDEAPKADGLD